MLLALGIVSALLHAQRGGEGQVVDAAMVDGTALLMAPFIGASAMGFWSDRRGTNLLDSGAPFYDVYRCADGLELAVGAIEPQFFATLLDVLGLSRERRARPERPEPVARAAVDPGVDDRAPTPRRSGWIVPRARDACVAPVLTMLEAQHHPHLRARGTIVERDGVPQPAPAPRFSATPAELGAPPGGGGPALRRGAGGLGLRRGRAGRPACTRAPSPEASGRPRAISDDVLETTGTRSTSRQGARVDVRRLHARTGGAAPRAPRRTSPTS